MLVNMSSQNEIPEQELGGKRSHQNGPHPPKTPQIICPQMPQMMYS